VADGSGIPVKLRWRLADDDCGQPALFGDDELLDRHVGRGEYRGLEFLHVNARRVINQVPASSRMPFRYTINAFRGCSHACPYCVGAETPILMADGRTRPIADLRPGDVVYGTKREGNYRSYVTTPVLAHWSTSKPAYQVVLEDGTELVASGDHRFLTDRGWKHVTGTENGRLRRPHLSLNNKLIGTGHFADPPELGVKLHRDAALGVVSIKALDYELPMYDITTGTGDFIANGIVSHNCFARPTHDYLGLNIGEDFERRIVVKVNAVERVRAELADPRWSGESIAMGTNTDPYQPAEGKYRLTRGIIDALVAARNPFSILTKSTLILGDLDRLAAGARQTSVRANLSIGTLDEAVWRTTEPGTPHPRQRVAAVARLNQAGVPCGVLIAPVLPGLSDHPDQLEEVVAACVEAGAVSVSTNALHLRPGVREHYMAWLERTYPELVETYRRRYRGSAYLPGPEQRQLSTVVARLVDAAQVRRPGRHVDVAVGTAQTGTDQALGSQDRRRAPEASRAPEPGASPARPAHPAQLDLGI
jgi:DNA repair photolyase